MDLEQYFLDILTGEEFCMNPIVKVNSKKCIDQVKDVVTRVVKLVKHQLLKKGRDDFCAQFDGSP